MLIKSLGILIFVLIMLSILVGCTPAELEVSTSREESISTQASEQSSAPETTSDVVQEAGEDMGGSFTEDLMVIHSRALELGVEVLSVAHTGKNVSITCQADSGTIFRDYLTALENSGRFTGPIPPPEGFPYIKGGSVTLEPKFQIDKSEAYYIGNQALAPMTDQQAIATIVGIAEESGIDVAGTGLRVPSASRRKVNVGTGSYDVLSFEGISVQGEYDDVMAFISDLESGKTLENMVLKRVGIRVNDEIETRATVDIDIYTKPY